MFACVAIVVGVAGLARGDSPQYAATWPNAVLHDGESEGKTMFGAEQRWISPDGEPVLFVHVVRADGKGVLRAVRGDNGSDVAQDVLVHDFGKDEMLVIARDDGALGFQFHSYRSHPNKYLGVLGNHVSCDAKSCCHGDASAVAAWPRAERMLRDDHRAVRRGEDDRAARALARRRQRVTPVGRSAELFGEPDEKSLGPPDVAESIRVFVLDHFADELRPALVEPGQRFVDVVHGEHDA